MCSQEDCRYDYHMRVRNVSHLAAFYPAHNKARQYYRSSLFFPSPVSYFLTFVIRHDFPL